jgi:predicted N-acetyltransferase YhbS
VTLRAPEPLRADHDFSGFDCGAPELNDWLKRRGLASEGLTARTFVVCEGARVVGYYTLAAGAIMRVALKAVRPRITHNTPDEIPVLLIGRLAVDKRVQRAGIGRGLLKDALLRALLAAQQIGIRAIVVHALDDAAAAFYRRFGFQSAPLGTRTYLLPIETVTRALA